MVETYYDDIKPIDIDINMTLYLAQRKRERKSLVLEFLLVYLPLPAGI
jgi:hypothetical protein